MDKINNFHQSISNLFIEILEEQKNNGLNSSWFNDFNNNLLAYNAVNKNMYDWLNQIVLSRYTRKYGYEQNKWITENQAKRFNAVLIENAKPCQIYFFEYKHYDSQTNHDVTLQVKERFANNKPVSDLNYFTVPNILAFDLYNIEEFEGLPNYFYEFEESYINSNYSDPDKIADEFIKISGATVSFDRSLTTYKIDKDNIVLPYRYSLNGKEPYYKLVYNATFDWFKYKTLPSIFYSDNFTPEAESLIKELFSAYAGACNCFSSLICQDSQLIDAWIKMIKEDNTLIVKYNAYARKILNAVFTPFSKKEKLNYCHS